MLLLYKSIYVSFTNLLLLTLDAIQVHSFFMKTNFFTEIDTYVKDRTKIQQK